MGVKRSRYDNHSAAVIRSPRWKSLRFQAKRRDGFRCVQCKAVGPLEVDHIKPVRTHPELAFALDNLQSLCASCHSRKTRIEVGLDPLDPARQRWRNLVRDLAHSNRKDVLLCLSQ